MKASNPKAKTTAKGKTTSTSTKKTKDTSKIEESETNEVVEETAKIEETEIKEDTTEKVEQKIEQPVLPPQPKKRKTKKKKNITFGYDMNQESNISLETIDQLTDYELNTRRLTKKVDDSVTGFKLVLGYLGIFLILIGALSLLSLIVLVDPNLGQHFYKTEDLAQATSGTSLTYIETSYAVQASYWWTVLAPGAGAIFIGLVLYFAFLFKRKPGKLQGMEDIALIFFVWILAILIFAMPFLISPSNEEIGYTRYNFHQAIFEITSGLTTTGLSVMNTNLLPRILVFHRSLANFVGGVGLVLILTTTVSSHSGLTMYSLEGHNDQLLPNMKKSARMIFIIYSTIAIVSAVALLIAGCSPMDAICFSMAAVSTGGLASHSESVYFFESQMFTGSSLAVEIILFIEMMLGSTNFVIHYFFWTFKPKKGVSHFEFLVFIILICVIYPFMAVGLFQTIDEYSSVIFNGLNNIKDFNGISLYSPLRTLWRALFEAESAISTTGFCSLDPNVFTHAYGDIASVAFFVFIIIMAVGGMNGSTSGGIKQNRIGLFVLNIKWSLDKQINRQEAIKVHHIYRLGEKVEVSDDDVKDASNYIGLYLFVTFILTFAQTCFRANSTEVDVLGQTFNPYSVENSLFETISYLSGIGDSCGLIPYSNAHGYWGVLWLGNIGMFIGRLEVTIFLLTFKRGAKLLLTRRNNYSAHLMREKKRFTALDHKAYREELAKKKEEARLLKQAERESAEIEASEALQAIDNQEANKNNTSSAN